MLYFFPAKLQLLVLLAIYTRLTAEVFPPIIIKFPETESRKCNRGS